MVEVRSASGVVEGSGSEVIGQTRGGGVEEMSRWSVREWEGK